MSKKTPAVFLDANIIIAAGKPPGGPELDRVKDLVEAELITILTTDLTVTEVSKKHAQNDFDLIREICQPHFRKTVKETTDVDLPELKRADLRAKLKERYDASTNTMLEALGAKALKIDEVKASIVFDAYAKKQGFFAQGKKDQFPDAFLFECLKGVASKKAPVIIVSADQDYVTPVQDEKHITLVNSFPELFEALGLQMQAPAVDKFLEENEADILESINEELSNWGLQSDDVMDAEIDDIVVDSVELHKVTAFKPLEDGGAILVVACANVSATISYTHPNWDEAMYDSEDKVLIPFDNVNGDSEIEMNIDIAISLTVDENGEPDEIEELRFRNSEFQYVTLYPPDYYK